MSSTRHTLTPTRANSTTTLEQDAAYDLEAKRINNKKSFLHNLYNNIIIHYQLDTYN